MTTYFVDSTRPNDTGNGLTLGTAKKTVQAAVTLATSAGDFIDVYNGTYRESVTLAGSGTVGNPITMRAAASQTPIISGAENMTGFTLGASNIWDRTATTTQPHVVIVGAANPKFAKTSRAACTAAGDWFWVANTLSVFSLTDPNSTVEVGQRDACITTSTRNYWTLQGLKLQHANGTMDVGGKACLFVTGAMTGLTIDNCDIYQGAGSGIFLNNVSTNFRFIGGSTITYCGSAGISTFSYAGHTGVLIGGDSGNLFDVSNNGWYILAAPGGLGFAGGITMGIDSGEVSYGTISSNGIATSAFNTGSFEHGIYLASTLDTADCTIHHVTATSHFAVAGSGGAGIKVRQGAVLHHNTLSGNIFGIALSPTSTGNWTYVLHHNQYDNDQAMSIYEFNATAAAVVRLTIYNETIFNGGGDGSNCPIFITDDIDFLTIKNCIVHAFPGQPVIAMPTQTGTVAIDYNDWWRTDGTVRLQVAGVQKTFAQWQALGYDAHGMAVNPLWTNTATLDFKLTPASPAIDAGIAIAPYTDGFVSNAPDMGALELAAATAAVTGTATASITEADVVAGAKTIILTLTDDTWLASGALFDAQRQAIINGLNSAQAEGGGWNAQVRGGLAVTTVARTSSTVVTITLSARAAYNITAPETITVTIPGSALTRGDQVIAAPTFTVSQTDTPPVPLPPYTWIDVSFVGKVTLTPHTTGPVTLRAGG